MVKIMKREDEEMMNNKRGMSTIITTVIMVALALVAVGIVWAVLSGVITDSSEDIGSQAACLQTGLEIVKSEATGDDVSIAVKRAQGSDELGGIAVVVYDIDEASSDVTYLEGNMEMLTQKTTTITLANAARVTVSAYYNNADGEKVVCTNIAEHAVE